MLPQDLIYRLEPYIKPTQRIPCLGRNNLFEHLWDAKYLAEEKYPEDLSFQLATYLHDIGKRVTWVRRPRHLFGMITPHSFDPATFTATVQRRDAKNLFPKHELAGSRDWIDFLRNQPEVLVTYPWIEVQRISDIIALHGFKLPKMLGPNWANRFFKKGYQLALDLINLKEIDALSKYGSITERFRNQLQAARGWIEYSNMFNGELAVGNPCLTCGGAGREFPRDNMPCEDCLGTGSYVYRLIRRPTCTLNNIQ